jgi:undecaprenyl-diphosphatase
MENFPALTHSPLDDSFPSLHAASSFSFASALFFLHHPYAPYALAWAPLVAFSRLYLGVHYLSDLVGGIVIGVLCGALVYFCIG